MSRVLRGGVTKPPTLRQAPSRARPVAGPSAPEKASLLPTSKMSGKASTRLLVAIRQFEQTGGQGGWFLSKQPWDGAKPQYFYLVKKVGPAVVPTSPIFLMRLENSRSLLERAVKSGVPVVMGEIAEQFQAGAAALGEGTQLADDAIRMGGIRKHKSLVLLPPETREATFAHEQRHWEDFESPEFDREYARRAKPLLNAAYLSPDEKSFLQWAIWELRGHAAGEQQARLNGERNLPGLDRSGARVPAAEQVSAHDFEAATQANVFLQNYRMPLKSIANKAKAASAADYRAFLDLVGHFNVAPPTSRLATVNLFPGAHP